MRQGPRFGLFFTSGEGDSGLKLLTYLGSTDIQEVDVYVILLCEAPGHEHFAEYASGCMFRKQGVLQDCRL